MSTYSQHPEIPVPLELESAVERVATGVERVIVLTDSDGEPQAALVSLSELRQLDVSDALRDGAEEEESDRVGLKLRDSELDMRQRPETD